MNTSKKIEQVTSKKIEQVGNTTIITEIKNNVLFIKVTEPNKPTIEKQVKL